ncbi:MAG: type II toxin-antitoxin system HicB family antitoxin [Bacillota bacterium]|nr:type II toxin-antitoxin system HicB family antitoxin [Bacillota bacterium]
MLHEFTGIVTRQKNGYAAICLELDVDSTGYSPEEARDNLIAAIQRHIDDTCEDPGLETRGDDQRHRRQIQHYLDRAQKGEGFLFKVPIELITRN